VAEPAKDLAAAPARNGPPPGYRRAIAIDVRQPYYNVRADGACADLAIAPTAGTAERLGGQRVLWRRRPDGIDILVPPGALAALAGGPPLFFTVGIERPSFCAVTDLPAGFGSGAASLCLSNRRSRAAPGEGSVIAPDWTRSIGMEAALDRAESLRRNDPAPPIDGWAGSAEAAAFLDEAAGMASNSRRLPFALLELHIAAPGDGGGAEGVYPLRPGTDEAVAPVRYGLEFEPRRTRWRYVITSRSGTVDPATLSVCDPAEKPVLFAPDVAAPGPLGGSDATCAFLSAEPIALAQRPLRSFFLQRERGAARRAPLKLVDPLPGPGPDALVHRGGGGDGSAAVSEIYVYL
jgi:hypothetical protein